MSGVASTPCYTGIMQRVSSSLSPAAHPAYTLEPGLLSVLRVLVGIQLLLLPATLVIMPLRGPAPATVETNAAAVDVLRRIAVGTDSGLGPALARIVLALPLALFAFWPGLSTRLGRLYLPIFVIYYALAAALAHAAFTAWVLRYVEIILTTERSLALLFAMESAWTLFVLLLFGVVMVAWQYDIHRVLWYVLLLALAEMLALSPLLAGALPWLPLVFQVFTHAAIYTMVGFVITRMMAAQRAQRRALYEANVQLAQFAAAQEQLAVSRERNRMARELHDTLAHSLSAVAVQLEAVDSALDADPGAAHAILGKALAQTRSGLTETRRALHELRASPLDDLGLALALQNLALTTAQRNGMTATVTLPERPLNLPPEIEQGVYRIAQEALTNASRHAGATQITVTLSNNEGVSLTVTDNGRGFDVHAIEGDHMGLQLMRERAALMGGVLDIRSTPGAGATVRLALP